ncbi:MAG: phosphopantothenoylcysteine decarboxylase [Planctomycetota bacterium]
MHVLITAGPTREPIDPVRYLSNHSTGGMGLALCRAAMERGHQVTLVLGPVAAAPPEGAAVVCVETALEMRDAVLRALPRADAVICAAAVGDYRPAEPGARKLKRRGRHRLELVENPDIAAEVGARKGGRPLVIYALETDDPLANGLAKLEQKNADLCVVNGAEAVGAASALFHVLGPDGEVRWVDHATKEVVAGIVLDELGF